MPGPRHHRFRYVAVGLLSTALLAIAAATAWAEESITLDFIRHGESIDNMKNILDTMPPATGLSPAGMTQANDLMPEVAGPYAGIYASQLLRTQETADPLADHLGLPVQILPGLNEIGAGIYDGQPVYSLDGLLYLAAPIAWVLGADFVPIPGSTTPNGVAFNESFSHAVATIYHDSVTGAAGNPTDLAFSSEGAIATWTLMNVKNPDFALVFNELLKTGQFVPNVGQVVVHGNPQDGWTLVSFDGQPVPQDPGLPTELFVDVRNLLEAPQFAAYDIQQAILGGDPAMITSALQTETTEVDTALANFPTEVIHDLTGAAVPPL
jgi:broad specificity phosphatase PhoE